MERECGQCCGRGAVLAVGAFGCCGTCMGESARRFGGRCGQVENGLREMRVRSALRASRDTDGRCGAAFIIPWKARAAGVSREGGGLGQGRRARQDCGLRRSCCVASHNLCFWRYARGAGFCCCGTRSGVWACEAVGPSCGMFVLRVAEQQVRWMRRDMHGTSGRPGVHRSGRKGVVPRVLRGLGSGVARQCVWRDCDPRPVVVERVVADLATTRRRAGGAGVVWLWQTQWLR